MMVKKMRRDIFHEIYARLKNPRGTTRVNANKLFDWLSENGYIEEEEILKAKTFSGKNFKLETEKKYVRKDDS